jgi:hypothetical protein
MADVNIDLQIERSATKPSTKLQGLRQKYPQYNDMSDQDFADSFHSKFYSDMDKGQFYSSLGLKPANAKHIDTELANTPKWAEKYPNLYGVVGAVKETARLGAEGAAITGGAIAGTVATGGNPVGGVVGAGIAYAGVREVERYFEGLNKRSTTEGAKDAVADIAMGSLINPVADKVAGVVKGIAGPIRKALTDKVTGRLTQETEAYIQTAKDLGYTPTPAEIASGKSKGLALLEGTLSYLPTSASIIHRARVENLGKLVNLRNAMLDKGANEASIESVGYKIRQEAEEILKRTIKTRGAVQKDAVDSLVNRFMTKVNANFGADAREHALSTELDTFFNTTGNPPQMTPSASGKTIQDVLAQVKNDRYKEAGEKLESVKAALGEHRVTTPEAQKAADALIMQELESSYPDAQIIRALKPYASEDLAKKPLRGEITIGRPSAEGATTRAQSVGEYLGSPEMQKKNPELYGAWMAELSQGEKTWAGLDLDRQKLGALSRKENALQGTDYAGSKGSTTPAGRIFTMLRASIEQDMANYAEKANPDAYKTFMEGRKQWFQTEQLFDNDTLRLMKKSPEDVFKGIVTPGEVENIRKMKEILGEKDFQPIKDMFMQKLIAYDKKGVFDVAKTINNVNKFGETVGEILSPEEKKSLSNTLKNGQRIETDAAKSKLMSDMFVVDGNGNVKALASKKKILGNKEKLSQYYTEGELGKLDETLSRIEGINIKNLARNKSDGMRFLGVLATNSPDAIVNAIVKPNNTINIRYMKRFLGADVSKQVESKFVENYLMKINDFGYYSPGTAARKFNQYDTTMRQLMDDTSYKEISNLMKLNRNASMLERLATNPSQTGQTLIAFETAKSVAYALASAGVGVYSASHGHEGAGIAATAMMLAAPPIMAKFYLSSTGRKYLTEGYGIKAGTEQATKWLVKMAQLAGIESPRETRENQQQQEPQGKTKVWE